jgi:hypothetical protein
MESETGMVRIWAYVLKAMRTSFVSKEELKSATDQVGKFRTLGLDKSYNSVEGQKQSSFAGSWKYFMNGIKEMTEGIRPGLGEFGFILGLFCFTGTIAFALFKISALLWTGTIRFNSGFLDSLLSCISLLIICYSVFMLFIGFVSTGSWVCKTIKSR